ncbi:MAG: branched-chain amino acid ABC transporter permease [Hungatella sp.]|nr:branched-chain amino acid ABC transporter permease [Hungatella sp.]
MSRNKKWIWFGIGAVFSITLPMMVSNPYALQFFINMLLFAYLATGWNIIGGYAGQMALGNGVYFGIGAYVSTVLFVYENLSPWVGMVLGGGVAAFIALLMGRMTFCLSGSYFSLSTVAVLHVIRLFVLSSNRLFGYETRGAQGIYVPWRGQSFLNMQFEGKTEYYYIILAFFVIGLFISWWIKTSRMGYYLAAINTNQEATSSLGVNVMGMKLKASCISAFMTALGGSFYAQFIMMVDPSRVLGYDLSVQIMLYAAIGGRGTLAGPVIAAFLLAPLNDLLRAVFGTTVSGLSLVFYGLALMLIIYFIPQGIWPYVSEKLKEMKGSAK